MRTRATKRFGWAVAGALALTVAPAVAAAGGSGPAGTTTFYVDGITLTTSTGLRVLFYLQTDENDNSIDIFGRRSSSGGFETHRSSGPSPDVR